MSLYAKARAAAPILRDSYRGKILNTVGAAGEKCYVTLNSFSEQHFIGPCRWQFNGISLPQKNDECLVGFDENKEPWLICWWPASPHMVLSDDTALADASHVDVPTEYAVKSYVDAQIATVGKRIGSATGTGAAITATTEATATTIISLGPIVCDGSDLRLEFFAPIFSILSNTGSHSVFLIFRDDTAAVRLGHFDSQRGVPAGFNVWRMAHGILELTGANAPAAGEHTYSVRGYMTSGATNAGCTGGAGGPGVYVPLELTASYV